MTIVHPYGDNINFVDRISIHYRQRNKDNGNEEKEREKYRRLYQDKIQREQNQLENEKWDMNRNKNMNMSRTRNIIPQAEIIVPIPMEYIISDGIKHYHKTESIEM